MNEEKDIVRLKNDLVAAQSKLDEFRRERDLMVVELNDTREQLEKYKLISDFAHDWEMWFDPDGKLQYVSPSFRDLTGYTAEELLTQPGLIRQLIHPEDLDQYEEFIRDSINFVLIRQSLNFRIFTRTRQVRWCEIKSRAVYNKRGKYLGQRASVGDITKLMQALGEIESLADDKELETRAKQKYINDLAIKDRELVSFLMSLSQKNETLQYIRKMVGNMLPRCRTEDEDKLRVIIEKIDNTLFSTESWEDFILHFEKVHPGFFKRLSDAYPDLTSKDRKLCAYLRLQLATKEIAVLMNITPQSAEISRVRLRKKLQLTRNINLVEFLTNI